MCSGGCSRCTSGWAKSGWVRKIIIPNHRKCSWGYGLLEKRICSCKILRKLSWKILWVLTKFWTRSHGKFDLFLRYFLLLENRMCSCRILRKLSWKFWCVLVHFAYPRKVICVLVPFLILVKNLMCSYKRIMFSPGKFELFLSHPNLLENLICSRNLFKKIAPGKKEQIF